MLLTLITWSSSLFLLILVIFPLPLLHLFCLHSPNYFILYNIPPLLPLPPFLLILSLPPPPPPLLLTFSSSSSSYFSSSPLHPPRYFYIFPFSIYSSITTSHQCPHCLGSTGLGEIAPAWARDHDMVAKVSRTESKSKSKR